MVGISRRWNLHRTSDWMSPRLGTVQKRRHKNSHEAENTVDSRRDGWRGLLVYNHCVCVVRVDEGLMDATFKPGTAKEQEEKGSKENIHITHFPGMCRYVGKNGQQPKQRVTHSLLYRTLTEYTPLLLT